MAEREKHLVGIVVFVEAEGASYDDAASGACLSITHALHGGELGAIGHAGISSDADPQPEFGFVRKDGVSYVAKLRSILEVGMALGNGYLWAKPTRKAEWR